MSLAQKINCPRIESLHKIHCAWYDRHTTVRMYVCTYVSMHLHVHVYIYISASGEVQPLEAFTAGVRFANAAKPL